MRQFGGWYWPEHERHMVEWVAKANDERDGRLRYQGKKQDMAMRWCASFRTAVDIGGHVGTWAWYLARRFQTVHAFEPVADHRACFALNVDAPNVILHPEALGAAPGRVRMWTEDGSSGNTQVRDGDDVEMRTLDSYALADVDFLKADCEGFELYVMQGAVDTLKRCRPIVCVEQKPGRVLGNFGFKRPEAVHFLESLGMVRRQELSGDFILSWAE